MMKRRNPIFEKNYGEYLRQLEGRDPSLWEPVLGIAVDRESKTAEIPFFKTVYRASPSGVSDASGRRPDYATCVILLKYLLMCPEQVPPGKEWVHFRDTGDAVQGQSAGLAASAAREISKRFAGGLKRLETAVAALGGAAPETEYPYDLSAVIMALPKIPVLLLFNDAEENFPAKATTLYERRAERFLDAECRVMIDWRLLESLKLADR